MTENYSAPQNYNPVPQPQFSPPPPPSVPPQAPVRGKSKWRLVPVLGALVLGLIIGGAAAGGAKTSASASAVSQPTATATTTVTAKPVQVPVTPASCISALSLADQGFSNASDAFNIVSQMMDDIKALDATALQGHIADLNGQTTKMQGITGPYNAAKAECRASQ